MGQKSIPLSPEGSKYIVIFCYADKRITEKQILYILLILVTLCMHICVMICIFNYLNIKNIILLHNNIEQKFTD